MPGSLQRSRPSSPIPSSATAPIRILQQGWRLLCREIRTPRCACILARNSASTRSSCRPRPWRDLLPGRIFPRGIRSAAALPVRLARTGRHARYYRSRAPRWRDGGWPTHRPAVAAVRPAPARSRRGRRRRHVRCRQPGRRPRPITSPGMPSSHQHPPAVRFRSRPPARSGRDLPRPLSVFSRDPRSCGFPQARTADTRHRPKAGQDTPIKLPAPLRAEGAVRQ